MRRLPTLLVVAFLLVGAAALTFHGRAGATGIWSTRTVPGNGEAIASISCYTATNCVGVSLFSREVIITSDAGDSWKVYQPRTVGRYGFTSVECVAPDTCLATGLLGAAPAVGAAVYKSTDGGRDWELSYQRKTPRNAGFKFNDVTCVTTSQCLVTGTDGIAGFILYTSDGARTWTRAHLPPQPRAGSILGIDCASARTCFAVQGTTALVYKSTNGGHDWTVLAIPRNFARYEKNKSTPTGLDAISCGTPSFCVAGGYIGHLNLQGTSEPFKWVTHNGGATWSFTNPFASTGAKTPSAVSQNAIACTSGVDCTMGLFYGDVYSTTDAGRTWTWDSAAPPSDNNVLSVACMSATRCLFSVISNFPQSSVFAGKLWMMR
jgi:photosystem II stability/assembly factor-like uncharacterized protein